MKFRILSCLIILLVTNLFISAQEKIDVDLLMKEVTVDTQQNAFAGYFYKMEFVRVKKNLIGKSKLIKRYEVLLPSFIPKNKVYQHPLLLVYDSSTSISAIDIVNSRNDIVKGLEKIETSTDTKLSKKNKDINTAGYLTLRAGSNVVGKQSLNIDLLELINGSEFSAPKEIEINGRDVISIDFRPKTGIEIDLSLFYLKQIEGTVLIDKTDKRIMEIEGFPLGTLEKSRDLKDKKREEARVFHYLQTRVPEGFWFPQIVTLDFIDVANSFNDLPVRIEFKFSDYRRFDTEVKSVEMDPRGEESKTDSEDLINQEN
jgi:hypothetical protein